MNSTVCASKKGEVLLMRKLAKLYKRPIEDPEVATTAPTDADQASPRFSLDRLMRTISPHFARRRVLSLTQTSWLRLGRSTTLASCVESSGSPCKGALSCLPYNPLEL
jgi:hypothetical protein